MQEFLDNADAQEETPAAHYLYNIDNESESLSNNARETLHSQVPKALYMAKCGRTDLLTAVC